MINCRSCGEEIGRPFIEFGELPLVNTFVSPDFADKIKRYPVSVYFCERCTLMQLQAGIDPKEIFSDSYKYFSSYSMDLLEKSRLLYEETIRRFDLKKDARIVEIASNDGYLLKFFKDGGFGNILGVEPTLSTAAKAIEKGIPTRVCFFDESTAGELAGDQKADIIIANNVIAHVPDVNGFAKGISLLLKNTGTAIIEFQYAKDLILLRLFDLIYHEHYSYFSLNSVKALLANNGLEIFKVEKTDSQGGSLRIFCSKKEKGSIAEGSVEQCLSEEKDARLDKKSSYVSFADDVIIKRKECIEYLAKLKKDGFRIAAYGASAKGGIFLNYLGINRSVIDYIVDRNENKQGMLMAGTGIPVFGPEKLYQDVPDLILILSWNLSAEIVKQNKGFKFFTMMPSLQFFEA